MRRYVPGALKNEGELRKRRESFLLHMNIFFWQFLDTEDFNTKKNTFNDIQKFEFFCSSYFLFQIYHIPNIPDVDVDVHILFLREKDADGGVRRRPPTTASDKAGREGEKGRSKKRRERYVVARVEWK
ncbi:hypothetical protein B9Z55_024860 [Caenorhabditis nigoni]|uniref:Uncharacterized protein n=1 Tax=Caenorhabditis nigoni TaxID=1611254 RepID=A0A2G5SWJ8_9PELO|nr:hypothetical protein B9Z55_024860 [Caenorhabditis nigoni]